MFFLQQSDTIPNSVASKDTLSSKKKGDKDLLIGTLSDRDTLGSKGVFGLHDQIGSRSAIDLIHPTTDSARYFAWKFNSTFLSNDNTTIDTLFRFTHLVYPQQKNFETYTYIGNLGGPVQFDHFFTRDESYDFLFARYYDLYSNKTSETEQYNVRSPFTRLFYSNGGANSKAEQVLNALHTQNLGKHFNFGLYYNFYGTKGIYQNQEARNNIISLFANYYKGNLTGQFALVNKVYNNEENGGVTDPMFVRDTIVEFIPFKLATASSVLRNFSFSANLGYTIHNVNKKLIAEDGSLLDNYIPLVTTRLLLDYSKQSRLYTDTDPDTSFYNNFYISPNYTRDSVSKQNWDAKLILEIAQFAKIPGMPGVRGWVGYNHFNYHVFTPQDFLYPSKDIIESSAHLGVGVFSDSPFIGYRGALRLFFSGYRADDKDVDGEIWLSPWKDVRMPRLRGTLKISETTPEVFVNHFFSNHTRWDNSFAKEKRFKLQGALEVKRWEAEIGYNLIHIKDFVFFNQDAVPDQTADVTVTSFYAQKNFRFFNGFNFFNRVVWQGNTNSNSLSIPNLMVFSSAYYERVLIQNALTGQLGFNVYYRTKFYADAYSPSIAQFYSQRVEKIGGYPLVDAFLNFKWKRALIYLKLEHANQGYPNNEYFATYLYPYNPRIFKFGVLWTFYD
jgi:hypothetical protein